MVLTDIKSPQPIFGRPEGETRSIFKDRGAIQEKIRASDGPTDARLPGSQMVAGGIVPAVPFGILPTFTAEEDPPILFQSPGQIYLPAMVIPTPLGHMNETYIGPRPGPFTHLKIGVLLMQVEILHHPVRVKPSEIGRAHV